MSEFRESRLQYREIRAHQKNAHNNETYVQKKSRRNERAHRFFNTVYALHSDMKLWRGFRTFARKQSFFFVVGLVVEQKFTYSNQEIRSHQLVLSVNARC